MSFSESKDRALEEQSLSLEELKDSRSKLEEMQDRWFRSSDQLRELKLKHDSLKGDLLRLQKDLEGERKTNNALHLKLESWKQTGENFDRVEKELGHAKSKVAQYESQLEELQTSLQEATVARNGYRQKALSLKKDIVKLLHRVEGSVSAYQLGLILEEKDALEKANEQLKVSLAKSELSRLDDNNAASGASKKKGKVWYL